MAQAPGVGVPGMGDPRADAPFDFVETHRAGAPAVAQPAQPVAKAPHVVVGQAPEKALKAAA